TRWWVIWNVAVAGSDMCPLSRLGGGRHAGRRPARGRFASQAGEPGGVSWNGGVAWFRAVPEVPEVAAVPAERGSIKVPMFTAAKTSWMARVARTHTPLRLQ